MHVFIEAPGPHPPTTTPIHDMTVKVFQFFSSHCYLYFYQHMLLLRFQMMLCVSIVLLTSNDYSLSASV